MTVSLSRSSVPNPNDDPASTIEQLSVPNDGPASTIQQLSVPNKGPAHFKQLSVPMIVPQSFSATTATMTTTMTQVPATATTNAPKYQIDKYNATQNLLLFFVRNDPAITISSLLLPRDFERPAIMTYSLQLIVEFPSLLLFASKTLQQL